MSTRSHILIKDEGEEYKLYHHFDGYPEGVGSDLKAFLDKYKTFDDGEERDTWYGDDIANALVKGEIKTTGRDYTKPDAPIVEVPDNGYEITACVHGDEEYVYVIDCEEKTLTCYVMDWNDPIEETLRKKVTNEIPDRKKAE